jgi:hypothetical protein
MRLMLRAAAASLVVLSLNPMGALAAPGETAFAFLKLGVGARAMGLGSAYVALADDPTSLYWNPAGLASVHETQVTAMHNEWMQDFRQEYAAVGLPFKKGSIGFSFQGFYSAEALEGRDEVGNITQDIGFNDLAMTAAYGRTFSPGLDAGLAVRYIRGAIAEDNATAFAFDFGGKYRLGESGLSLGAAAQNIGGNATYVNEAFPLPTTFRLGAAYSHALSSLHGAATLSTEVHKSKGEDTRFNVGGEFAYKERLALRAGAKMGYDVEDFSFGLGIMHKQLRFDYALVPLSLDLGTTHFFSLTAKL